MLASLTIRLPAVPAVLAVGPLGGGPPPSLATVLAGGACRRNCGVPEPGPRSMLGPPVCPGAVPTGNVAPLMVSASQGYYPPMGQRWAALLR